MRDENAASWRAGSNLLDTVTSRGSGRDVFDDDDYASSVTPFGKRGDTLPNDNGHNGDVDIIIGMDPVEAISQALAPLPVAPAPRRPLRQQQPDEFDYDIDGQAYDEDVGSLEDPGDVQGDPDEKKYCYCNRISFGQMVGCARRELRERMGASQIHASGS